MTKDKHPITDMLSTKEAAQYLGVSSQTIFRWEKDGIITPAAVLPGGFRKYTKEQLDDVVAGAK